MEEEADHEPGEEGMVPGARPEVRLEGAYLLGPGRCLVKCLMPFTRGAIAGPLWGAGDGFIGFTDLSCLCGKRP